jgi:hypothetical protein
MAVNTRRNGGKKSQISTVKFRHGIIPQASLTISYRQRPVASRLPSGNLKHLLRGAGFKAAKPRRDGLSSNFVDLVEQS